MPWPQRLTAALAVCLMLASCASSPRPGTVLPRPLPVVLPPEHAARCPAPGMPPGQDADAVALALKDLYDLYGVCAGRLADLVDFIQQGRHEP